MSSAAQPPLSHSAEKKNVSLHSMLAAAIMTLLKLTVGVLSGSLGMISEAAHSGLDMLGAAFTYISVRVSDKPADEDHTYGHGKFENLSSFGEVILMAVSSGCIIWEGVRRIIYRSVELDVSIWPFLVVLLSIAVDVWRSRKLKDVAERTGSSALATDAFHFSSDIWSSLTVLVGLAASWAGGHFHLPILLYADPLAAIVVSLLILRLTVVLGLEAVNVLLDEIPAETHQQILRAVETIPGVLAVERTRARRAGAHYFVDVTLALPRSNTFEHNSQVVQEATAAVHRVLPEADVVIHTTPGKQKAESVFDQVRAVAARNNVSVHDLSVLSRQGRLRVEQHLEIDDALTLTEAHNFVTEIEKQILTEAPEIHSVQTHIESRPTTIEQPEKLEEVEHSLRDALDAAVAEIPEIVNVHQVHVGRAGGHIAVSCHCKMRGDLLMSQVQEFISQLEFKLKLKRPEIYRVNIHPEPLEESREPSLRRRRYE